jgi:hypothetical protein
MFQMITGRLPYEASSPVDLIKKIVSDPPARARDHAPDVPEDVERLVAHLIEKKPSDRPHDAADVARMCRRVIEGDPLFEESAVASSLRAARDVEPSTSTGTTGLSDMPLSRRPLASIRRIWQEASVTARMWTAGVVLIVVAGALGQLAAMQTSEDLALQTINRWDRAPSAWTRSASIAEFVPEAHGVTLVTVNLPRMRSGAILATGTSEFVIEFTGARTGSDATARAIGRFTANPQEMRLVLPPVTAADEREPGRLIGVEVEPSPAFEGVEAVFVAHEGREFDGRRAAVLQVVDASLGDKGYGHELITAADVQLTGRASAQSFELATASPWTEDLAIVVGDGSADGYSVVLVALESGAVAGRPRALGGAGAPVHAIQFARDGSVIVARATPGGGLNIRQHSQDGDDMLRYSTADASATLADLTTNGAIIFTGPADERTATHIDLQSGVMTGLGAAVAAARDLVGDRVLVTAPDYRGNLQVHTVRLDSENRVQLTFLEQGVGTKLSVSRDGRFAVADLVDFGAPGLVLVSLESGTATQSGAP